MQRRFTIHTATESGGIKSPFRFCEKKARHLADRMNSLTGAYDHFVVEVSKQRGLGLVAYEQGCICKRPRFVSTPEGSVCTICERSVSGDTLADVQAMVKRPEWYI